MPQSIWPATGKRKPGACFNGSTNFIGGTKQLAAAGVTAQHRGKEEVCPACPQVETSDLLLLAYLVNPWQVCQDQLWLE